MTGANYTGGKRNFARARFRDTTRRLQKNHFGRRRLAILSCDLGNGNHSKKKKKSPQEYQEFFLNMHKEKFNIERPEFSQEGNDNNNRFMTELSGRQRQATRANHGVQGLDKVQMGLAESPRKPAFSAEARGGHGSDYRYSEPASDYEEYLGNDFIQGTAQSIDTADTQLSQDEYSLESLESCLHPTAGSSGEANSSSPCVRNRRITPDLASTPLRLLPTAHCFHKAQGPLFTSSSKVDLIPEILARDDPWNAIGDMLDLPPIPSADATYFSNIRSLQKACQRASPASSPTGRVEAGMPVRDKDTQLRAVLSEGALIVRPSSSQVELLHRTSSPLLCQNLPAEELLSSVCLSQVNDTGSPCGGVPYSPSLTSGSCPNLNEASHLLEPQTPPAPPLALGADLILGPKFSEVLVTERIHSSVSVTPQRPTFPSQKHLNSPETIFGTMQWDAISEFGLDALIPELHTPRDAEPQMQLPKLECPNLFND
ncbi:hypothetical protein B0F90DRAFT_1667051 [Multifurca ochricompacta]|uniref:Uncharacterized protein n=1 Tax=Multifurca ochricompacta TaxID=376703 RepID=A0AAD4M6V0_9AGAM|nr:hypothetical protein B0F90DRAFT_1667051 [Multifurca ochricompacta]